MVNEAQKNCIITGPINSYCLLCEGCLKTQDSIRLHIQSTPHKEKMKTKSYLENYKNDGVQRLKRGYFCEFCNIFFQTKSKIAKHVSERTHLNIKGMESLQEVNDGVIALNCIFIEDNAWHGVIDNSCVVCNVDITDGKTHKQDSSHIFNLIQCKVEFLGNKDIFRKMDDDFFNCLTCNMLLNLNAFSTHFENTTHLEQYTKCKELCSNQINGRSQCIYRKNDSNNVAINTKQNITINKSQENQLSKKNENPCIEKKENDILHDENINKGNKNKVISNMEKQKTIDLKKSNGDGIITTLICNNKRTRPEEMIVNSGTKQANKLYEPHEAILLAKNIAKQNNITYKYGKHSAYCKSCNVTISSTLSRMQEHISECKHRANMAKKPTKTFVNSLLEVKQPFTKLIILNETFCISCMSYLMINSNEATLRCHLCETSYNLQPLALHVITKKHKDLMNKAKVMCSLEGEFVREIRDNLYHCGFCNMITAWDELDNHLQSLSHNEMKLTASQLLRTHLAIYNNKRKFVLSTY